jgi:hypothetical protein
VGQLVAELSPYEADLNWDDILGLVDDLGQATAKIHCISDIDSDQTLVPFSTDNAIHAVLDGREDDFIAYLVGFGEAYGAVVRHDYVRVANTFMHPVLVMLAATTFIQVVNARAANTFMHPAAWGRSRTS